MVNRNEIPQGWAIASFEDLLDYIQPTEYIVASTEYNDTYKTPVLTAGKSFIKGYTNETNGIFDALPVIIFDDFTTATQFVNFPFKVKSSAMKILKPTSELVNIKLAFYFMQTVHLKNETHKRYWISEYSKLPIPLAPLKEQQRIFDKIEELITDLDKGVEYLETAQQLLKVYKQSLLKWAFEGKLTGEWRRKNKKVKTAFETLKEVSSNRKNIYDAKKKKKEKRIEKDYDFVFSKSEIIDSWVNATLDKLIYIAGRIGWRGLTKDEYTSEGPLFLSVHSLNYGKYVEFKDAFHISEERFLESPEIILKDNDILLCKDGAGIGKIGIIKKLPQVATVNSSLLIIRGLEIFTPEFLFYLFSGPKLQNIVQSRISGSTTPHLFQNDIRKFQLLVPPIEEQKQIVQELEIRLTVCDKVEEIIESGLLQSEALRLSIIKKGFEGKLVKQDLNDEPAEKLLERIRAEIKKNNPEKKKKIKIKNKEIA